MNLKYLNSALKVGLINDYTPVKTSGTEQRLIKYFGTVGCSDDNYTL